MNFTAKEDYGIRAVLDIALNQRNAPIQAREIAARQNIPEQFLEQLLSALRRAGIVRSIRGAAGGYDLGRPAQRILIGDILRALSGPIVPLQALSGEDLMHRPEREQSSVSHFWAELRRAIEGVVDRMTVQDLVELELGAKETQSFMMNI